MIRPPPKSTRTETLCSSPPPSRSLHGMSDPVDDALEPIENGDGRDGDGESDGGRQQGLPDATRQDRGIDLAARRFHLAECFDHAEHRTEQAEKRTDRKSTRLNSSH